MSYITPLEQVQSAQESSWGTKNDTSTAKLMNVSAVDFSPVVNSELFQEVRGSLQQGFNTAIEEVEGMATIEADASYQDIPMYLDSLFDAASPSGANPYVYDYAAPTTALPAPLSRSLHYGQSGAVYVLVGGLITQLDLSGESSKPIKINSKWGGTQVIGGTITALSDRSTSLMMGDQAALYIDAWGGTIGTTQISSHVWSWSLSIKPNRHFNHTLGSLTPISWHDGDEKNKWSAQLKLSLEFSSTTKAYLDTLLTASPTSLQKQIRIKYTTGSSAIFQMDFAGTALAAPGVFTDKDGLATYDITLDGTYNSGLGNFLKFSVTNAVSAMP